MSHYRIALYEIRVTPEGPRAVVVEEIHRKKLNPTRSMSNRVRGRAWDRYIRMGECGFSDELCRKYVSTLSNERVSIPSSGGIETDPAGSETGSV